jgi:hypothetical protein
MFDVAESSDYLKVVVDRVAAAAALAQYLAVLESSDDVFDPGPDAAVRPVAVVADDPAVVSAVAEHETTIEQLRCRWWGLGSGLGR